MIDVTTNYVYRIILSDGEELDEMVFHESKGGFLMFFNLSTCRRQPIRRSSIKSVTFTRMLEG